MSSLGKVVEKHQEFQSADLLVVDTQGYELEVLKGFKNSLDISKALTLKSQLKLRLLTKKIHPNQNAENSLIITDLFLTQIIITYGVLLSRKNVIQKQSDILKRLSI